jgi:hypothetical protein
VGSNGFIQAKKKIDLVKKKQKIQKIANEATNYLNRKKIRKIL